MSGGFNQTMQSAQKAGFSPDGGGPGAVQSCPMHQDEPHDMTRAPCFVPVMMVSAVKKEVTKNNREKDVSGDKVQVIYRHGTTLGLPAEVKKHLAGADLLLQIISSTSYAKDPTSVFAQVTTQPQCGVGTHPLNEVYEAGNDQVADQFGADTKTFQVIAPEGGSLFSRDVWKLIWPFTPSAHTTYHIDALSCGIPVDPKDTAPPRVRARVEVYRRKTVTVKVKLPSKRTLKKTRANYRDLKTGESVTERGRAETSDYGRVSNKESVTEGQRKDGTRSSYIKSTETTTATGYIQSAKEERVWEHTGGQSHKTTHSTQTGTVRNSFLGKREDKRKQRPWESGEEYAKDGDYHGEDMRTQRFSRPVTNKDEDFNPNEVALTARDAVQVIVNGRTVQLHMLGALLRLPFQAKNFIKEIKDAVPKIGWWAEFDMRMLTSELSITGTISPSASALHDRVWLLERHATFQYKGELLAFSASIAFGFEYRIEGFLTSTPVLSIVAKVQFGIAKAFDFIVDFDSRRMLEVEPKLETTQDFVYCEIVGEATAFGFGYKASGKVSAGLKFGIEGRISAHRKNELKGELHYAGAFADFEVVEHGKVITSKRIKLGEKDKELWRGDIIGGGSSSGDMPAQGATTPAGAM